MIDPILPEHMQDGMRHYLEYGIKPGSFLYAVLSNDLAGAVGKADHINLKCLPNIVAYCHNYIPADAWGSPELVETWIARLKDGKTSEQC